jgi:hypothetical protein
VNHSTRFIILFSFLFSANAATTSFAGQLQCTKDDAVGKWTSYSVDLGVADHVEYQEKIDVVYLQTVAGTDQFLVSFSGAFSAAVNPWSGKCIGDQYVLNGEISSHDNVHFIQAARNPEAPATDQCSLERCESTCVAELLDECSVSKAISDRKLTFMLLPGHVVTGDANSAQYLASEYGCFSHDCNHPGLFHNHEGD